MEEFKNSMLAALEDKEIVERFRLIFEPIFQSLLGPITSRLLDTVQALTQTVNVLKSEGQEKDKKITALQNEVAELHVMVDNHEQHGRRDLVRIFGLSEESPGSTDDKVLRLCNIRMKLNPPLTLSEISVSHRVGKPREPPDDEGSDPRPRPRPLLVKFATRRIKNRVMAAKKKLRKQHPNGNEGDEGDTHPHHLADTGNGSSNQADVDNASPSPEAMDDGTNIYIGDDLTKTQAKLAYQARQAKRNGEISDTWVFDSKKQLL